MVAVLVENVGAALLVAAAARESASWGLAVAGLWLILLANLALRRGKGDGS